MGLKMIGAFRSPQGQMKVNKPPRYATFGGNRSTEFTVSDEDMTVNFVGQTTSGTWAETDLSFDNGATNYYWEIETYANPADDRGMVVGIMGRNPTYTNQNGNSSHPQEAASMRYNINRQLYFASTGTWWQNSGESNSGMYWNDAAAERLMFAFNTVIGRFYLGRNNVWANGATSASIAAGSTTGGKNVQDWFSGQYTNNWPWYPIIGINTINTDNKLWSATGHFDPKYWTYEAPAGFVALKE